MIPGRKFMEMAMNIIDKIDLEQMRFDMPDFRAGDTVKVHIRIVEGSKERVQIFQGVVIKRKRGAMNATFTVRKISHGVGVEKNFRASFTAPGEGRSGYSWPRSSLPSLLSALPSR